MRIPVFTTKESFILWHEREIEAMTKNGLRQAKEEYESALKGVGRQAWLDLNHIPAEDADEMWSHKLQYLADSIRYIERKIKRYQKKIDQCRMSA